MFGLILIAGLSVTSFLSGLRAVGRKGYQPNLVSILASLFIPFSVDLFMRIIPVKRSEASPEEYKLGDIKRRIDKIETKENIKNYEKGIDNSKSLENRLTELYEQRGRLERHLGEVDPGRFIACRVKYGPEGAVDKIGLPYQLRDSQAKEIRMAALAGFGIDPGDDDRFYVSFYGIDNMKDYSPKEGVLVYDTRDQTLVPLGNDLRNTATNTEDDLKEIGEQYDKALGRIAAADIDPDYALSLRKIGNEGFAVCYGDDTLAYCLLGNEGKIRARGETIVRKENREIEVLCACIKEELKNCMSVKEWLAKAGEVCSRSANEHFKGYLTTKVSDRFYKHEFSKVFKQNVKRNPDSELSMRVNELKKEKKNKSKLKIR